MNLDLPEEAVAFGQSAAKAFLDLGGVDAARAAEMSGGRDEVGSTLSALGVGDLDPRADLPSAAAAAELCRAAGQVVLPFPVVGVVLSVDGRPFAVGPGPIDHGDLFPAWRQAGISRGVSIATPSAPRVGSRLGPFVTPVSSGPPSQPTNDALLHLTLTSWMILGTLERAVDLAVEHVNGRIQFGQPIAAFQAVQFQLADAAVAVDGLRELCRYTLWAISDLPSLADALAVRLAALDAARAVLRTTQQLFGAAGVCDEYDISVMCRHIQPALRIPFGAERTAVELAAAVDDLGFTSLFPHGGAR